MARESSHVGSVVSALPAMCVSESMVNARQHALRRLVLVMDSLSIALAMVLAALVHASLRSRFDIFKDPPPAEQYLLLAWVTVPMMLGLVSATRRAASAIREAVPVATTGLGSDATACERSDRHRAGGIPGSDSAQSQRGRPIPRVYVRANAGVARGATSVAPTDSRHRRGPAHLLLVGNDPALMSIVASAAGAEPLGPEIVGVLGHGMTDRPETLGGVPFLGVIDDLSRVLHERTIDEVVLATHGMSASQFEAILAACDELGTPMRHLVLPEFHDGRRLGLERQYGLPFVTLAKLERSTEALAVKRAIDAVGSLAVLFVLTPLLLLISLLILATMGRPVVYMQERIGYQGRRKFRHAQVSNSMVGGRRAAPRPSSSQPERGGRARPSRSRGTPA